MLASCRKDAGPPSGKKKAAIRGSSLPYETGIPEHDLKSPFLGGPSFRADNLRAGDQARHSAMSSGLRF